MSDQLKDRLKLFAVGGAVVIGIIVLVSFFGDPGTPAVTEKSQTDASRDTDRMIASAKAELEKTIAERGQDGKPGKLTPADVLKPEVVLPPVIALLGEELDPYGINREELSAQIKSDPDKFRVAVPEHWRKRFLILTPAHEKLAGDKFDAEIAAEGKIYQDDAEMKRVRQIAEKIVAQLPEKTPIRLFLVRDDSINAFCLPNGSIYIHSGLLKSVESDDELAFVIAHEYAHYAARHGNECITKYIFLMAGDVFAEGQQNKLEKEGKVGKGLLLRVGYLGGGIVGAFLPFKRKMESEADTFF